jgi:hypothetical protein
VLEASYETKTVHWPQNPQHRSCRHAPRVGMQPLWPEAVHDEPNHRSAPAGTELQVLANAFDLIPHHNDGVADLSSPSRMTDEQQSRSPGEPSAMKIHSNVVLGVGIYTYVLKNMRTST